MFPDDICEKETAGKLGIPDLEANYINKTAGKLVQLVYSIIVLLHQDIKKLARHHNLTGL